MFSKALAYPRFRTVLVAAFALLAVVLALVGIYSVLSYLVAEQTPEIGVRLALGALRRDIFRRVIGGSLRLVLTGVVVGLVIALVAVRGDAGGALRRQPARPDDDRRGDRVARGHGARRQRDPGSARGLGGSACRASRRVIVSDPQSSVSGPQSSVSSPRSSASASHRELE